VATITTQNHDDSNRKNLDDILDKIPKPPRLNYQVDSNQKMIKIFQLMVKGHDVFSIADIMQIGTRQVSLYKRRIKAIFGDFKDNLDNNSLYTEIQKTKSSISSDIDILRQIAIDKNTPSTEKIEAIKASISTKMLLLRIEFDGMKAIMELEDLSKRNKMLIDDHNKMKSSVNYLELAKDEENNNTQSNYDDNTLEKNDGQENGESQRESTNISEGFINNEPSNIISNGTQSTESIDEGYSNPEENNVGEKSGFDSGEQYSSKTGIIYGSKQHTNIINKESNFQV